MPRLSYKVDDDHDLVQLGCAIRARRLERGISQEVLAVDSDVERSHLGKIERGQSNLTVLKLIRIADALDCKAADILMDAKL